jgi:osmotically-inducible protein OsmY
MNAAPGSKSAPDINSPETMLGQNGAMRSFLFFAGVIAACASASGCMTVAGINAAANVGVYAAQDRTIGEGIDDTLNAERLRARLREADRVAFAEVDVEIASGNVLLSGATPSEQHRAAAESIARGMPNLRNVYNEIFVAMPADFARNAQDQWIGAQIRARLAASPDVRAIDVNIETFRGNVYLLGTARSERELRRSAEIASLVAGVQRVVSFVQVRPREAPFAAAALLPSAEPNASANR